MIITLLCFKAILLQAEQCGSLSPFYNGGSESAGTVHLLMAAMVTMFPTKTVHIA